MEVVSKALALVAEYGPYAAAVLAGCAVALAVIAPLTKTKLDDKLLGWVSKAQTALAWVLVKATPPSARVALANEVDRQAEAKAAAKK